LLQYYAREDPNETVFEELEMERDFPKMGKWRKWVLKAVSGSRTRKKWVDNVVYVVVMTVMAGMCFVLELLWDLLCLWLNLRG